MTLIELDDLEFCPLDIRRIVVVWTCRTISHDVTSSRSRHWLRTGVPYILKDDTKF